jgi:5'-nucleotidase
MLETATGVKAFSVGKPSAFMMRAARKDLGLTTDQTTMIGDTMETDILGAVQLGFHSVLVLSGGTRRESLGHYAYQPDLVVDCIAQLHELLDQQDWQQGRVFHAGRKTGSQVGPSIRFPRVEPRAAVATV